MLETRAGEVTMFEAMSPRLCRSGCIFVNPILSGAAVLGRAANETARLCVTKFGHVDEYLAIGQEPGFRHSSWRQRAADLAAPWILPADLADAAKLKQRRNRGRLPKIRTDAQKIRLNETRRRGFRLRETRPDAFAPVSFRTARDRPRVSIHQHRSGQWMSSGCRKV